MKILMRPSSISITVFLVLVLTGFVSAQQIGDEVTCYKASSPPKIDGKLNEWFPETSITGPLGPDSDSVGTYENDPLPEDADDCSFEMFAMWDADNFYVAFGVVDDSTLLDNPAGAPWDAPDHDIVIAASDGPLRDGRDGWVIELRLGKDSFDPDPLALKPDQILGMIIFVNDTDEDESRSRMVVPGGGNTSGIPTSDSFLLVLSAETAAVSPIGNSATTWGQVKAAD